MGTHRHALRANVSNQRVRNFKVSYANFLILLLPTAAVDLTPKGPRRVYSMLRYFKEWADYNEKNK